MAGMPPSGVRVSYQQHYRRCGKATCSLCAGGGRGHGPYWYAAWWEGGRTRTRYLGKAPPAEQDAGAVTLPPAAERAGPLPLRVQTLGAFALWREGAPLPVAAWAHQRTGALCKWLLAAPGQRLARDQAIELLWPEAPPETGGANLRVLVHRLRRVLGEPHETLSSVLQYDGESLTLAPGRPDTDWLDAAAFEAAATRALAGRDRAACRVALTCYTGDYLPDDPHAEWALGRRETLRQTYLRLLLHTAALCQETGETEEAIGCLHAALAVDRCQEEAALALMRLHVEAGRLSAALRVYRQLAEALREELGLRPHRAARELAARLQAHRQAAPPPAPTPMAPSHNLPATLTSLIGRGRGRADGW